MDGVTATQQRQNDPTAMADLTVTAINSSAMDGSAMDGAMAWQWMALRQCGGNGHCDGNGTLMEAQWQRRR